MGIRESLLNTITSVGNGDFIRIVTSAGASSKATLQNVIKSFETGLGAKSSLTTSDYIRVVGSDNNLYKQSLSDMKIFMGNAYVNSLTSFNNLINSLQDGQPFVHLRRIRDYHGIPAGRDGEGLQALCRRRRAKHLLHRLSCLCFHYRRL